MSNQVSAPTVQPVKLWTPRVIMFTTFILSFISGIGLACINWIRMGLMSKAIAHFIVGLVGFFLLLLIPGNTGRVIGFLVNIGVLTYLHIQMKNDIAQFRAANHPVQNANWLLGFLIGLGVLGILVGLYLAVLFILILVGVPIPE